MFKKVIEKVNKNEDLRHRKVVKLNMLIWNFVGAIIGVIICCVGFYVLLQPILNNIRLSQYQFDIKSVICIFVFILGASIFSICTTAIIYALKINTKN